MPITLLFVCLGNICRSPVAEGAFRHLVKERELDSFFAIDSCGTSNYHIGERADSRSRSVAARYGIQLDSRARQWQQQDLQRFHYVFAMDQNNYRELLSQAATKEEREKIGIYRSFDPLVNSHSQPPDMPDPYYGGIDGFVEVQEIALRTSHNLLNWLLTRHNIPVQRQ